MVTRLSISLLLLPLLGTAPGCASPEFNAEAPVWGSGGGSLPQGDDDDDGLPAPQGFYDGEVSGLVDDVACEGEAWVFLGSNASIEGEALCEGAWFECGIGFGDLTLPESGALDALIETCVGPLDLSLRVQGNAITGGFAADGLSIELFTLHIAEEGD